MQNQELTQICPFWFVFMMMINSIPEPHLEGALPMSKFLKMKSDLAKDTDIIFY